ncbi:MAG: hypothetical protein LC808_34825 [Actinobacteria bacterium]|nr:hypothetical protein [Actinomycetota bacterium]
MEHRVLASPRKTQLVLDARRRASIALRSSPASRTFTRPAAAETETGAAGGTAAGETTAGFRRRNDDRVPQEEPESRRAHSR